MNILILNLLYKYIIYYFQIFKNEFLQEIIFIILKSILLIINYIIFILHIKLGQEQYSIRKILFLTTFSFFFVFFVIMF
jgi:hypothetical protein